MASSEDPPAPESQMTEPVDLGSNIPLSLNRAVFARRAEYVRPHRIRVKIGTWNVAACPGTDKDLASWFVSGKGLDSRFATLDLSDNTAFERGGPSSQNAEEDSSIHLVGGDKIGLYVLGLQEVIDLNITSQYMTRVYTGDRTTVEKWKKALEAELPPGYQHIASEQMTGLMLLIYASPDVAPTISNVSTVSVGTGLLGYLGNKGAVTTRIVLGESTKMTFVNCHLASGDEKTYLDRRIWDVSQILSRTHFDPITHSGVSEEEQDMIGDEDFGFWFGDLNFRLDGLPGDDIRRLLMLHARGEYDVGSEKASESLDEEGVVVHRLSFSDADSTRSETPSAGLSSFVENGDDDSVALPDPDDFAPDPHDDPASLQATLDSLISHDQLLRVRKKQKVFHDGWREGPITFLPTYKYDVGTVGLFDTSEKKRAPSWCDRILYRTRKDNDDHKEQIRSEEEARKKDEEMKARGMEAAGDDDEVLFDYDPDTDGDDQPQNKDGLDYDEDEEAEEEDAGEAVTNEGPVDRIHLDVYTSHQRITSSDHKPVISVFTLDYDATVPELKAKVHAEVARELDRAENEGRPTITVVVDGQENSEAGGDGNHEDPAGQQVNFGEIRFLEKVTNFITLANTGRVSATFSFVEKPSTEDSDGYAPPQWLTTSLLSADDDDSAAENGKSVGIGQEITLEPGETAIATLEVRVDTISHARMLNDGHSVLEDVLVLRVTEGRDHFIPVRATWLPTCIGRSLEELIRVPSGGIRNFVKARAEATGRASIPYDLEVHSAAPRELFKLTEAIESLTDRVLADESMIEDRQVPRENGWPFDEATWKYKDKQQRLTYVVGIIDALDNDKPVHDVFSAETASLEQLEVVGEVLLLFLRGLTDGIITMPLWARIEQASLPSIGQGNASSKLAVGDESTDDKTTILDILESAPNHNISFVFLTATLGKIIAEFSPLSKADLEALKTPPSKGITLGRRSLSFRRSGTSSTAAAIAALEKRQAKERRFAELFASIVCRAPVRAKEKEKRSVEDKQRAVLEIFLRRREDN